jgi:hypothetical protein
MIDLNYRQTNNTIANTRQLYKINQPSRNYCYAVLGILPL